jgi:hypothetical protein
MAFRMVWQVLELGMGNTASHIDVATNIRTKRPWTGDNKWKCQLTLNVNKQVCNEESTKGLRADELVFNWRAPLHSSHRVPREIIRAN